MSKSLNRAQIFRVFLDALDLEPELRDGYVRRQANGDDAVRAEVEALLGLAMRDATLTGAFLAPEPDRDVDLSGETLGRFRLLARIGEGGMGVVYRAERIDGVTQSVAVKVISAVGSAAGRRHFEREAQHLARLEHPSIARLIDAGFEPARAWIAMEFVRGERIDAYCDARRLSAHDVVALLVQIADSLVAAHGMLVVHSDIKPANVLVTAQGAPKLIDFGISTALRESGAQGSQTVAAGRLFSPGFAAPEQISGDPVTVATDIFGLGALAYRLLTGKVIFPEASEPVAYMLAISQRDVALPSRVASIAKGAAIDARQLRGDLDAILCKALERDPSRRYASMAELQADLQRYLERRPVLARRQTLSYRSGRFVRRNALAVGLAGLLLVSLGVGGFFLQWQSHRAYQAREMAARRGEFLAELLKSADPRDGRRDISVAELLDAAAREMDRKLGDEPLVEASMLGLIAQTDAGLGRFAQGLATNQRQLQLLRASGGSARDVGLALKLHAELLNEQGKWREAEAPVREAIDLLRPLEDPADLCGALDILGAVLLHTDREREAEATYLDEIARESRGGEALGHMRMYPLRSLAVLTDDQGRYEEAVAYGRQALDIARRALPPDAPDLLKIETNYAGALANFKRGAEAEPLFREVIAAQTRVNGATHKDTLLTQYSLARDLLGLGRDAEAAALSLDVAKGLESALGPENTYTLGAWLMHGMAICNTGAPDEALPILRRVEAVRARILPPGDWLTAAASLGVGTCLARAHRYAQAEPVLLKAVAALEISRGPGFARTQTGYEALRDLYLATNRSAEAARWSKKVQP